MNLQKELDAVAVIARFENKLYLAEVLAHRFVKSNPKLDAEEFAQEGRVALWTAAQNFDPSLGVPFGAYATRCIKCSLLTYYKKLRGPKNTISLSHVLSSGEDGEDVTWADVFDKKVAHRELCTVPGDGRLASRIADVRALIDDPKLLTKRQRKILRLTLEGLSQVQVAKRMGVSPGAICGHLKESVRRLRDALGQSVKVLPGATRLFPSLSN